MLKSTEKLLTLKKKTFQETIKKYKNSLNTSEKKKDRKIKEALMAAKENADFLRRYKIIEDFEFDGSFITFGTEVSLKSLINDEEKVFVILGIPDIKFNPRYNKDMEKYLGYPNHQLDSFIGKKEGDTIDFWKIIKIKLIDEIKRKKELK